MPENYPEVNALAPDCQPFVWSPKKADLAYIAQLEASFKPDDQALAEALKKGCYVLEHGSEPKTAVIDMDDIYTKKILIKDIRPEDCLGLPAIFCDQSFGERIDRINVGVAKIMENRFKKLQDIEQNDFAFFGEREEDSGIKVEVFHSPPSVNNYRYWLIKFYKKDETVREIRLPLIYNFIGTPNKIDVESLESIIEAQVVLLH